MPLPLEVGSMKMIDPESMDDSNVSDQNNSNDDAGIPYFSDVEAMILEMDLTHAQESCLASEEDDAELFAAACYAVKTTLTAVVEMFESTRSIMSWLGDCAKVIAVKNYPVQWTSRDANRGGYWRKLQNPSLYPNSSLHNHPRPRLKPVGFGNGDPHRV
ncbi:unnamed protein product [Lactuca saligna]|uniref:DNA-directed RNA polymerase n=1 Tax=Lactuca saligna TaxID=75948 RepID=A0AA36EKH9_LACSI|nr:unnamed protein product [Lactuca saligna]